MNGLLIIDKPQGMTSHDVVARARRLLREKRIGHAGTLDPMATGVLVLCIGHGTRLSEYLLGEDKAYEGVITLGQRTNTDDAEGEVIATRPVPDITDDMLRALEAQFSGEIEQVPPQFSAIHKGGQRAYALARRGETVEMDARRVTVRSIRLATRDNDDAAVVHRPSSIVISVACSSGTYIRSLARDIGEVLGCGGHLSALRRTQAGTFTLTDAVTLAQIEATARDNTAASLLLPMDRAVAAWPEVVLDEEGARKVLHGQMIPLTPALSLQERVQGGEFWRVYDDKRVFIAVARWDAEAMTLAPVKVFDAAPPLVQ